MISEGGSEIGDEFFPGFFVFGGVVPRLHLLHGQMELRSGDDVVVAETLSVRQNLALRTWKINQSNRQSGNNDGDGSHGW